ncbi:OpgC family protein [Azospirillum thermophilum]|uniref:OpgC domain-containing protein n=1 Tax=Azospirillum thermophilum TaxID=2202148 RepID=A0A2S2CPT9_9PROT|nr:OpgC domain-containing protein [Azospirillum thermophilum]AWK86496.1 hypothetical protein DEW08_09805 [Azospirillum thermophilum]
MQRLELLDGLRGYFLVFMLLNHLWFDGGNPIALINHNQLSFVEDAQGFILISGLIVGLYYGRLHAAGREAEAGLRLRARVWELYLYSLAILGTVIGLALLLPGARAAWSGLLGDALGPALPAAALLLHQPTFMDILPQYMIYLAVSPLLIRLTLAGRGGEVVAGSFALWAAVQFGLHLPLVAIVEPVAGLALPGFELRGHFNPLAWQLVFVVGLVIGTLMVAKRVDLGFWFSPERGDLARIALGIVLFFMVWRVGFTHGLIPDALAERFFRLHDRAEFSLVYLVNFAALAYLVTWLLAAGPESRSAAVQWLGWGLHRLFRLRFLRFLGGHSLQVYAWHVVVAYLVILFDHATEEDPGVGVRTALTLLAVASLALPAWLHLRLASRTPARFTVAGRRTQ